MIDRIGKYRIIRELGKGATATVYLAEDPDRPDPVAIKYVRFDAVRQLPWDHRIRRLFQIEANVGRSLNHAHIVRVFDSVIDDTEAYIVMEYVEAPSLDNYIQFDNLLPVHTVVGIIFKCCLALDYAFRQGIVHRDIKPANILVDDDRYVKIADFGLAINLNKQGNEDSTFITGVGSPAYMSPEQIKGYPLNQKTDLYSLGVVLYQLLTGRLPFRASNQAKLIYKIINADAPPVSALNPSVPAQMDRVLRKALEKDLYSRYRNGADMAKDLAAVRYQILDDNYVPMDRRRFDIVRKLSFFREFADIEIWETLRITKWLEIEADAIIMTEGDEENSFGIIVEGEVEISLSGKRLCRLGAGEAVGEAAYLNTAVPRRTNTVTTLTPVIYLEVNPAALNMSSEECLGHFRQTLVASLVRRLELANTALAQSAVPAHQGRRTATVDLKLELLDYPAPRG
jgi:eukaryotic-like serine/threonine-protein kinase